MTEDGVSATSAWFEAMSHDDPTAFAVAGRLAAARLAAARSQGSTEDVESLARALGIVALRLAAERGATDPQTLAMIAEAAVAELDLARLSGSQPRVQAKTEHLKALADSIERVCDDPELRLSVAANAAIADFELARASDSGAAMEQAAAALLSVSTRAADLLGSEHRLSIAVAVNTAVARYEAARAGSSQALLDMSVRELAQISARLHQTLGDDHPYSVVIRAYLRDSSAALTPPWTPARQYLPWEQAASMAVRQPRPRPRRRPFTTRTVSLARILETHPDIVHSTEPAETLVKRDELLVLSPHADAVQDAARRWIDGREDFAELGVTRLMLRRSSRIDAAQLVAELRGGRQAHRRFSVVPNHVLRIEPAFSGDTSTGPTPAAPLPKPAIRPADRRVVIGILDTGVDRHPWFLDTEWFADLDAENLEPIADPYDDIAADAGHGTFVAGIVLQQAPSAYLSVDRAVGPDGVVDELEVIAALHRIAQRAVRAGDRLDVLNLSLGCYTFDDRPSPVLADAIARLSRRTVVVAAAGNSDADRPFWPAALKDTVAVAALADPGGQNAAERASFSNYGWWVDAAAPGQNVVSTFLDDGYAAWSGTSFAAPYVCGRIAALMTDKDMAVQDAVRELFDPNRGEHLPDLGVLLY